MMPKAELIKFVKENNSVVMDNNQKKFGRGAYICKNEECIKKAQKRHALSAKFKTAAADTLYDEARGVLDG